MGEVAEVWKVESHPSGSTVVTSYSVGVPWLYVVGPMGVGDAADKDRFKVCQEIAAFLNGAGCPVWFADMRRVSEETIEGCAGTLITAVGPTWKDDTDPRGWTFREDQQAKDLRARLIDRLWFARTKAQPA